MRIRWTPPAVADMQSISDYLEEHYPRYRQPTMRKLYAGIRALNDAAYRGRTGASKERGSCCLPRCPMWWSTVSARTASRFGASITRHKTGVNKRAAWSQDWGSPLATTQVSSRPVQRRLAFAGRTKDRYVSEPRRCRHNQEPIMVVVVAGVVDNDQLQSDWV